MISIPAVTTDELLEIHTRIGGNKILGLDGVPNWILKLAVKSRLGHWAPYWASYCRTSGTMVYSIFRL